MNQPSDIIALRKQLGLTQAGLAALLRMGKEGRHRVREWEKATPRRRANGEVMPAKPSGPAQVAMELLGLLESEQIARYLEERPDRG